MKKPNLVRLARPYQQGFSLVELMVAMTIGFIVVAAVGYIYLSSRQSFRMTDSMSRMQENARLGIETLARDVRMAGYVGCINLQSGATSVYTIAKPPVPAVSPATAIMGQDFTAVTPAFAGTTITRIAGDTVSVMGAFGGGVGLTGNLEPNNANVKINGNPYGFASDDVLVVADCKNADIFRATGVASASGQITISHASSTNISNNVGSYGPDGFVFKMEQYTYFIGTNPAGKRALYRTSLTEGTAELVEDVWDMQIEYGQDTNGDGAANTYVDATAIGANWAQVVSARISLLLASPENNIVPSVQTYNFNGAAVTAAAGDRRLFQVLGTTIAVRNRAP
ncbi:MAG: PilW family protein [Thiobacillus sp.]|nr:PilW family protein [Thiobacillus sp.]